MTPNDPTPAADDDERPTLRLVAHRQGQPDPEPAGNDAPPGPEASESTSSLAGPTGSGGDDASAPATPSLTPVEEARAILAAAEPAAYYKALSALVRPNHHSVLQPLAYSSTYDFHDPTCVVVQPEPGSADTVLLYASAAFPGFERVLLSLFRDPQMEALLNSIYQLTVNEGANVAVVTNHGQIIDIALVMGALLMALSDPDRSFGVLGEHTSYEDLVPRVNVLVSRMVTTRQAFNVPAIQILQGGSRTFLSIPQTTSRRRVRLDPAVVKANNVVARHELDVQLTKGGQFVAMAASGSQDLSVAANLMHRVRTQWRQRRGVDPGDNDTLHLQPLYDGTINVMLNTRFILPIAISLDAIHPACVVGDLTRVREKEDCHRIMEWIADAHEGATGMPTIYHRQENDLLTQIRSLGSR